MSKEKVFLDPSNAEKILTDVYTELNTKADKDNIPAATASVLGGIKSGGDISVSSAGAVTVNHANKAGKLQSWSTVSPDQILNRWCKIASIHLNYAYQDYHAVICATEILSNRGAVVFTWDCATSNTNTSIETNKIQYLAGSGELFSKYKGTFYTEACIENDGVTFNLWCQPLAAWDCFSFTLLNESNNTNNSVIMYNLPEYKTTALTGQVNQYTNNDWYGNASTATKLTTSAGSATHPVYFSDGVPKATSYTLGKSVPSDAKFTDTTYSNATASSAGLMSAADKIKLDGMGGGDYVLPVASSSVLGGVRSGGDVSVANNGVMSIIDHLKYSEITVGAGESANLFFKNAHNLSLVRVNEIYYWLHSFSGLNSRFEVANAMTCKVVTSSSSGFSCSFAPGSPPPYMYISYTNSGTSSATVRVYHLTEYYE